MKKVQDERGCWVRPLRSDSVTLKRLDGERDWNFEKRIKLVEDFLKQKVAEDYFAANVISRVNRRGRDKANIVAWLVSGISERGRRVNGDVETDRKGMFD